MGTKQMGRKVKRTGHTGLVGTESVTQLLGASV